MKKIDAIETEPKFVVKPPVPQKPQQVFKPQIPTGKPPVIKAPVVKPVAPQVIKAPAVKPIVPQQTTKPKKSKMQEAREAFERKIEQSKNI